MVFGRIFGKQGKAPFRPPREAAQLRMRIESENKENFPHLERYKEIARDAEAVYRALDNIIAQKEYRDEALKLQDDIKNKLAALAQRIQNNIRDAKKETSDDYVEKNIDYLERKSTRNSAKTLYTEFLEACDLVTGWLSNSRPEQYDAISAASATLLRTFRVLRDDYFTVHKQDREIQGLKAMALTKIAEMVAAFESNKAHLEQQELKAKIEPHIMGLQKTAKEL